MQQKYLTFKRGWKFLSVRNLFASQKDRKERDLSDVALIQNSTNHILFNADDPWNLSKAGGDAQNCE